MNQEATIVIVAGALAGLAFIFLKVQRRRSWGFKDVVKNPGLWQKMTSGRDDQLDREMAAAGKWSNEKVAKKVEDYIFRSKGKDDSWALGKVLKSLGPRVHRPVLQVLGDVTRREALLKETRKSKGLPETPFNLACDLLDESPPAEALALLLPFQDHPSQYIRCDAAMQIASIGSPEIIAPTRKALADVEIHVRSYAEIGLKRAIKHRRLSDVCRRELFADVQRLLDDGYNANDWAGLLYDFDNDRATQWFLSDEVFTADSPFLKSALHCLAKNSVAAPRDKLLNLIHRLESGSAENPRAFGQALTLLGRHKNLEDAPLLEQWLVPSSERRAQIISKGAASGLLALHGLDKFKERIFEMNRQENQFSLTEAQRLWYAVFLFDAEVRNGGLTQYFFNSPGDNWKLALAGLDAMRSTEWAAILREAAAKFGANGPSIQREPRQQRLARLVRKDEKLFEELERRYYASAESLETVGARYVIQNAGDFT